MEEKHELVKTALDLITKLEVLKAAEENLPPSSPLKVDRRDIDFAKVRENAKTPLNESSRTLHLQNVEEALLWINQKIEEMRSIDQPHRPQILVQLDAALERAELLKEYLLASDLPQAQKELNRLISWHLKS